MYLGVSTYAYCKLLILYTLFLELTTTKMLGFLKTKFERKNLGVYTGETV